MINAACCSGLTACCAVVMAAHCGDLSVCVCCLGMMACYAGVNAARCAG